MCTGLQKGYSPTRLNFVKELGVLQQLGRDDLRHYFVIGCCIVCLERLVSGFRFDPSFSAIDHGVRPGDRAFTTSKLGRIGQRAPKPRLTTEDVDAEGHRSAMRLGQKGLEVFRVEDQQQPLAQDLGVLGENPRITILPLNRLEEEVLLGGLAVDHELLHVR